MKSTFLLLALSVMLFSCSSDDQENQEVPEKNFYALTVGNTWVYKYYTRDQTTDEFSVFAYKTDSVKIVGTKVFNNNTYYEFYQKSVQTENNHLPGFYIGEFESTKYLRDSLGSLIYNDGNIRYWNNDYEERFWHTLNDTPMDAYAKLNESLSDITTEAGNLECYNMEIYAKDIVTNEQWPTSSHFYYTDGVGNVCEKIGYIVGGVFAYERRLDSYDIK